MSAAAQEFTASTAFGLEAPFSCLTRARDYCLGRAQTGIQAFGT